MPSALGLRAYISGKSLEPMLQLLHMACSAVKGLKATKSFVCLYVHISCRIQKYIHTKILYEYIIDTKVNQSITVATFTLET